ncbi:hypothetical protein APY04_3362 [Hyphomicrobium sulfonivorans]|uniref:Uncharacterized protein n=1 Tax=Hyphomicrobium sulfonivorans TaxID=121290 RepID=A0A125NTS0_HYPSL|nr:hypothetical protein APY04_3362 [Hyphomicrobium sulfonivorans]
MLTVSRCHLSLFDAIDASYCGFVGLKRSGANAAHRMARVSTRAVQAIYWTRELLASR